jgi:hypothetical protein
MKINMKRKQKITGKVSFEDDIMEIKMRKISFSLAGFNGYEINPPIISVPGRYLGFDLYLTGRYSQELRVIACYAKIEEKKFSLAKIYELSGKGHRCSVEAEMTVRYFENHFLKRKCGIDIVSKPWRQYE